MSDETEHQTEHQAEREIKQALEALGAVEAPPGLERRVLARLTESRAQHRTASWGSGPLLAAAGLVLAGSIWFGLPHIHPAAPQAPTEAAQTHPPLPAASQFIDAAQRASTIHPTSTPTRLNRTTTTPRSQAPTPSTTPDDTLAVAEMRAPSQPAPPIPITAQERLLQRAAQTNAAAALASAAPAGSNPAEPIQAVDALAAADEQPQPKRDVGAVLQASLFAGMKTAADE